MIPAAATFNFQEDINAYELASCMNIIRAVFLKTIIDKEAFDTLPDGVKRHFTITVLDPPADEGGGSD